MEPVTPPVSNPASRGLTPPAPLARQAAPRSGDDFSFKELVELINQGALIIRAKWYWGVLAALLIGGLAGYALLNRPAKYTAQTALLAQSTLDKVLGSQPEGGGTESRENNLRNHLSMMNSRKFRARLETAFTPEEKTQISAPYLQPGETLTAEFFQDYFAGNISVERERGREYYTIRATHLDPTVALLVADRLAAEYLSHVQEEYKEANLRGYEILEKQAEAFRSDIARVESERLDFRKKNGIISRNDNQGILTERLKRLDASLTEIRIKRVGLETVAIQARQDRARSEYPWDNAYLASFANNEPLRQELDRQMAERSVLAGRYGPNHPKLRDIDSQLKGIQANIQRNFDIAVRDLESQLAVAVETEKLLSKAFDAAFESSIEIEKLASNYEILSAGVDSKKITLNELERKIGEASISSRLPADFMQIVDPAYLTKPRIPAHVVSLAIVAFLALGSFLVTPLAVNMLDARIKGTSDLESVLGKPMLGAVPVLKFREEDRAHIVRNKTDLGTAEAFIGISAQLDLISREKTPKTVLITSTLPGEGKSTVASNLAAAYTQLGKKVVLVDLDLRRPAQHRLHGVSETSGFLSWARSNFPVENLLKPDGPLGLRILPDGTHLVPAGGDDPQPNHYLVSKHLDAMLEELKKNYDLVIIDTPPAGLFQDAVVLARHAQDRVLVTRESRAPVEQVKKAISDFERAARSFTGVVLNGFNPNAAHQKLAYGYNKGSYGYSARKPKLVKTSPAIAKA